MTCKYTSQDQMVRGAAPVLHRGLTTATPVKPPRPRKPWPVALLITLSLIACAPPPPEVNLNMPVFPGPFLDLQHCESTGGGRLIDGREGYTLWQMEQGGVDDIGWVQIRFEVRGGKLSCPVSFVNTKTPEDVEAGNFGSLPSAWQLLEGRQFTGAAEIEFQSFQQECYARLTDDNICDGGGENSGLGVWKAFSSTVNGVFTDEAFAIINGKVFDIDTWQLLE